MFDVSTHMSSIEEPIVEVSNAVELVKRGRRPKATAEDVPLTKEKKAATTKAKRAVGAGKSKAVYDVAGEAVATDVPEEETVIIKLDVHLNDEEPSNMDMDGPFAYNIYGDTVYSPDIMDLSGPEVVPSPAQEDDDISMKAIRLLMDFDEKCKNGEWPASTSVHCYWCCHRFKNVPIGIPLTYNEDLRKFMVYGCFCSCECAAAYNLDSKESSDELMTRHGFLNMLARELGHQHLVRPAPSRLVLSMFGGPMTIDHFRERCHTSRLILVNFPPMMTVTQQVEEINQRDMRSEYRYIPLDSERVNKYKEKIKLKRTKPLVNFKNTLDHTMNLKFA